MTEAGNWGQYTIRDERYVQFVKEETVFVVSGGM